jgi:hypothetical protein
MDATVRQLGWKKPIVAYVAEIKSPADAVRAAVVAEARRAK